MISGERWIAGFLAVVCLVFLARLLVGERRRAWLDARWYQGRYRVIRAARNAWGFVRHWRERRVAARAAAQQAKDLIERVRHTPVQRQGNVYTPQVFTERRQRGQGARPTKETPSGRSQNAAKGHSSGPEPH